MKKYDNLENLVKCNKNARSYFGALPQGVVSAVASNSSKIRTYAELMDTAERVIHEFV